MQILNPSSTQNTKKTEGFGFCPLDKPVKTLAPLSSDNQNKHRFVLGTFEKSELNKIVLVDFYEETFTFHRSIPFSGLPPVDHITYFYSDSKSTKLLVSFKDLKNKGTFLSVLTFDSDSDISQTGANPENKINKTFETVRRVAVDPHSSSQSSRLCVVSRDKLHLFHNFKEELCLQPKKESSDKYSRCFFSSRFDPHHKDLLCVTTDNYFEVLDLRQNNKNRVNVKSGTYHKGTILDFNFNPNLPNELATTGEDALLLFWDLRKTYKPLSSFDSGHGHWVKRVEYNSFQDQLVLTCGASCSFLHRRHDHFEKVSEKPDLCDISWSFDDAWFYASLLSNGLRVEMVPKSLKNTLLS